MENGHFILEILLLILVIALGFSYSEEVSSNKHLRAQLRTRPYWLTAKIETLEAEIVCKDEEIKRLTKSHQLTEDALYGKPTHPLSPITADDIKTSYSKQILGEWVAAPEETFECERCGKTMTSYDQASYNQFSQLDFNCCQDCADQRPDED